MNDRSIELLAMIGLLIFSGCAHQSVLPDAAEISPPSQFAWQEELLSADSPPLGAFCSSLGSGTQSSLAELQLEMFAANYDLQGALARFAAAEARAREVGASLLPSVSAQLQVTRAPGGAFGAAAGISGGGISNSAVTTYQPAIAASWEIDVWGRLRNQKAAALLDATGALEEARGLGTSLSASFAEIWFGIAAERALIEVLEAQLEASARFLELVKLRFGQGFGGAQDIGRQQEQVLGLEGQREQAQGRLRSLEAQAAALLGAFEVSAVIPGERSVLPMEESWPTMLDGALAPLPSLDTPLDLVGSRPDVVAAWRRLEAADRRLAAAVKQWLPGVTLTGNLFDFQRSLSALFEDLFWQVVGTVSQQVYQGGARAARIAQAQAAAQEALAAYAGSLVDAMSEVNTSIARLTSQREVLANLSRRREEAQRVLELTRSAYREGGTDYLNVIIALQSTQTLEQQMVEARRQQLANRVQLCRAAGLPSGVEAELLTRRLAAGALSTSDRKPAPISAHSHTSSPGARTPSDRASALAPEDSP